MIFTRGKTGVSRRALIIGGRSADCSRPLSAYDRLGNARVRAHHGNLPDRGTGIGTRDELFAVMRRIGIAVDASTASPCDRVCLDRDGTIAHELPIPAVTSSWARIYRRLRDALPAEDYRAGMPLARIEQDADAVTAIFADGTRVRGDLLIGADGLHSTVRRQFLPDLAPRYAGYVAWRGAAGARDLPPELPAHDLASHGLLFLGKRPDALDSDAGRRRWGAVPVTLSGSGRLTSQPCGAVHRCGGPLARRVIPPPLIRPEVIREVKASAQAEARAADRGAGHGHAATHPAADLRSRIAAASVRAGSAVRGRGFRRPAACRDRRHESGT